MLMRILGNRLSGLICRHIDIASTNTLELDENPKELVASIDLGLNNLVALTSN